MGQTVAEKIFSRRNLAGKPVAAGEMLEAKLDGAMVTGLNSLDEHLIAGGMPGGVPRLWDQERVYTMVEHFQPAPTLKIATRNARIRKTAKRLGMKHFHDSIPGIHHQMMCDYGYVRPGELIVATDSHAVLYGALNAAGCGIGEADMAYAVVFGELWFKVPSTIKIVLNGPLARYLPGKDVVMYLAGKYGDDFAQNRAIEYSGAVADAMSIASRMTLADQAVELGAKFGFFAADAKTAEYVKPKTSLPYQTASADPGAAYDEVIELEVDEIPFYVVKPYEFKNGVPVTEVAGTKIVQAVVGSCANGRFEDIALAARLVKGKKIPPNVRFLISPASYGVFKECLDAGILQSFVDAGAQVISPGCGICQTYAGYLTEGEVSLSTAPRNFKGRNGSPEASVYLAGPAVVAASAVAGEIVDPTEALREAGLV